MWKREGKFGGIAKPQGALTGLSRSVIRQIGDDLGVDKVLRGRIIDYGITRHKSFNLANGILGVALGIPLEGMGAYTRRDSYEEGLPPETYRSVNTLGGAIPLGLEIPPSQKVANVQIRLYLQDTETGRVLWSNRAFVRYAPFSKMDKPGNISQRMLDSAVRDAVREIMADLFKQEIKPQKRAKAEDPETTKV